MMFPTSATILTLIDSALLEVSDVNKISNSRFPVLPGGFSLRGKSVEMAKNVAQMFSEGRLRPTICLECPSED